MTTFKVGQKVMVRKEISMSCLLDIGILIDIRGMQVTIVKFKIYFDNVNIAHKIHIDAGGYKDYNIPETYLTTQ